MNSINRYKIIKEISLGDSSVQKYIVEKENKIFMLRLYDIRFMDNRYKAFNNIRILHDKGIAVPKIYDFGELSDNKHGYAVVDWIAGVSLDNLLTDDSLIDKYGKMVAEELLKMHSIDTNENIDIYDKFIKSFNKKINKLKNLGIDYPFSVLESFVLDNSKVLKELDTSIIHGDFHPGNIVINGDRVYFIDLDVCKNDFAWIDLSTNACSFDYPKFYTVLIIEYFDNNIPDNFWIIYNLYGSLYCLDYILYCSRKDNKTLEDGTTVLKKFLDYSDEFSLLTPKWFDNNKVLRKERLI